MGHGMPMVWSIDQELAEALALIGDRPFYRMGRMTFRLSKCLADLTCWNVSAMKRCIFYLLGY